MYIVIPVSLVIIIIIIVTIIITIIIVTMIIIITLFKLPKNVSVCKDKLVLIHEQINIIFLNYIKRKKW